MASATAFNFFNFKTLMKVADIDEATYGFIIRSIFLELKDDYGIDIDTLTDVPFDLQLAVFTHAKFIYTVTTDNLHTIKSVSDAAGGRTTYNVELPKEIGWTYKRYSDIPPASL